MQPILHDRPDRAATNAGAEKFQPLLGRHFQIGLVAGTIAEMLAAKELFAKLNRRCVWFLVALQVGVEGIR